MAPAPVGATVRTADGRTGVVVADALSPGRPVVRVEGAGGRLQEVAGAQLAPLDETARFGAGVPWPVRSTGTAAAAQVRGDGHR